MNFTFKEVTEGYWFYVSSQIYITVSKQEISHPILGECWNIVGLDGRLTWLSESAILMSKEA